MTISLIYFLIIATFLMLALSMYFREYVLGALSAMLLMVLGIEIIQNGLFGFDTLLTQALAFVIIGIGAYILVAGGIDEIKNAEG